MRREILKPRNDAVFKHLMRDKRLLVSFLQSALDLPPEDYSEVQLIDPHLPGERPESKLGILDVKVTTAQGNIIDIEIQLNPVPEMRERAIFYLSGMIREQVRRGESYRKVKRAICILITGYEEIHDSVRYHNKYMLYDPDSGSLFSRAMEVHTLELPKLPEEGDGTKLCAWLEFIRASREEEFEMLAQKDPDIGLAVVKLKDLSQDERLYELALAREKLEWDIASREEGAEKRGREAAQRAIAQNLLKLGIPPGDIAQATGLSQAEIRQLQDGGPNRH
ncbi:MAG: Rpn family recombination-promoting nuclease/putative transposase [Azoarcus sp.]|jgi:predicted transposase/invertase (TIGR01784 family)|nr:Rpn family recombination-promoting nuclease/putative transposase [Azoarcus sp.]